MRPIVPATIRSRPAAKSPSTTWPARTNDHFNATYFVQNPCPPAPPGVICPVSSFDITTAAPLRGPDQHCADADAVRQGHPGRALRRGRVEARRSLDHQRRPALGFRKQCQQQGLCDPAGDRGGASRLPGLGGARDQSRGLHLERPQPEAVLRRVPAAASASPTTSTATTTLSSSAAPAAITTAACSSKAQIETDSRTVIPSQPPVDPAGLRRRDRRRPICHDPDALRTYVDEPRAPADAVWVLPNKVEDALFGPVRSRCAQAVRRHPGVADVQPRRIAQHIHVCPREFLLERLVHPVPDPGRAGNVIGCTNGGDAMGQSTNIAVNGHITPPVRR